MLYKCWFVYNYRNRGWESIRSKCTAHKILGLLQPFHVWTFQYLGESSPWNSFSLFEIGVRATTHYWHRGARSFKLVCGMYKCNPFHSNDLSYQNAFRKPDANVMFEFILKDMMLRTAVPQSQYDFSSRLQNCETCHARIYCAIIRTEAMCLHWSVESLAVECLTNNGLFYQQKFLVTEYLPGNVWG